MRVPRLARGAGLALAVAATAAVAFELASGSIQRRDQLPLWTSAAYGVRIGWMGTKRSRSP